MAKSSILVVNKGSIKEEDRNIFIQELRALLFSKSSYDRWDLVYDGGLYFPKINHMKFNEVKTVGIVRKSRRLKLSKFSKKKLRNRSNKHKHRKLKKLSIKTTKKSKSGEVKNNSILNIPIEDHFLN